MLKIENVEVVGWEAAIRGMPLKGYRKTKSGKYEAFTSKHSKTVMLGTFNTEHEAKEAVIQYKLQSFIDSVTSHNLDVNQCVVYKNKYVVFTNGMIFNLHGNLLKPCTDHCGYQEVLLDKRMARVHRVVAETFIPNPNKLPCVNHIDGNKLNNHVSSLEWCRRSENTLHSFRNGLQKTITNQYGTFEVTKYA